VTFTVENKQEAGESGLLVQKVKAASPTHKGFLHFFVRK
jgi:hypothetical protein